MFANVPVCERCWFARRGHPPLRVVKVTTPEHCNVCDGLTVAGIFVRVGNGANEWVPSPADSHEPTASEEFTAGYDQGQREGYDHGYGQGYDACLRDNGMTEPPPVGREVTNVVTSL
jgi:hypothetical protein